MVHYGVGDEIVILPTVPLMRGDHETIA